MELRLSCTNPSIYTSVGWVIIDSGNDLSAPVGSQANTWPDIDMSTLSFGTNVSEFM